VAVQVTVLVPTEKEVPDGGVQLTVGVPQPPPDAIAAKLTAVAHEPASAAAFMDAGHWIVTGRSGTTLIKKLVDA
jgi:hypothetical protein